MLFQADMGKQTPELVRKTFLAERSNVEEEVRDLLTIFFASRATGCRRLMGSSGSIHSTGGWNRMATVDRNVLRGAVAEFLGYPATRERW